VATSAGTTQADRELREFKQRGRGCVNQTFHYHLARLIEILHSLERIEEELARHSRSDIQLVDCIGQYLCTGGGKRVRPAVLLLSSRLCGYDGPVSHRLGAVSS
jgi:geranylgeranyl pyrophosphate synthase